MSTPSQSYSGDITLNGDEQAPVKIVDPENIHIKSGAVDGDLKVLNAEYVYTNTSAGGETDIGAIETKISGTIEDGYIEPGGATGDVVIADAEDVFIEHDAVGGELQIIGDEQRFHDQTDTQPRPRTQYDDTVTGWERSLNVKNPQTGVAVAGGQNTARVQNAECDFDLYLTGWNNNVRINGYGSTVTLHVIGSKNTVEVSAYTDVTIATESGHDNTITVDDFPVEDLIKTSQSTAYKEAFIGRKKITYQVPAMQEDYCPGCGSNADAIICRHQEDAFFFFGYPIYQFEAGSGAYECEECSPNAHREVQLSESERKDLFK
jgi:hypothetical protein